MIDLEKISHEELAGLLLKSDDTAILEEMARRINLGLIPLATVGFSELSNKKLSKLDNLIFENCGWAIAEIYKRMKDGRIQTRTVTIEEVREMYRKAKEKYSAEKKAS